MSTPSLPSYSHAETPSYTAHPRGDERTLGLTSRARGTAGAGPLGDWTKTHGNATLALTGQREESELPVYGRHTTIEGFVTLGSTEGVAGVQIKLEGHVKCKTIAEIGRSDVTVLETSTNLWRQGGSPCPTVLPFEIPLSTTYKWGEQTGPLPPSFEYTFYDVQGGTPGLRAKIKYEISVEVEHVHPSLKDRLSSSLSTPLIYLPRSRPGRPPSDSPTTVFESVMEHRVGGKKKEVDPIVWKIRLPPPGTYAITQPIPFRVTVTSRSSSLIAPFGPSSKKDKAAIRVYVLRQVAFKVNTIDLWRSFVIAEGNLSYVPPSIEGGGMWLKNRPVSPIDEKSPSVHSGGSVGSASEREGWAAHDWTGELNVDRSQVSVGGFKVGELIVKDFIVLSVVPPNPRLGTLLEVKRVIPIQLTTDGWDDSGRAPPGNPLDSHTRTSPPTPDSQDYLEGNGEGHHFEGQPQNGTNGNGTYLNGNGNGAHHNGNGNTVYPSGNGVNGMFMA